MRKTFTELDIVDSHKIVRLYSQYDLKMEGHIKLKF